MALGALLVLCAPGCKVFRYYFPSDEIELAQDQPRASQPPPPISTDANRGLEVRLWVVDDTDWSAPRALLPFVDEPFFGGQGTPDESWRSQWAQWGFRVVALPIGQVDGFLESLRPVQPITEQWLGEFSQWRAIVRAGALGTDRVRVGSGSVKIERGRPRLIARSWIEPILLGDDEGVGAGVRLDLGMQIESSSPPRRALAMGLDRQPMIEDKGPVIDGLIFSMLLDGSHAIVIVGEAPEIRWDELAGRGLKEDASRDGPNPSGSTAPFGPDEAEGSATPATPTPSQDFANNARRAREPARAIEPKRPIEKTLGELMLTGHGSRIMLANRARVVPKRVLVVLIPHVGGGFSLLPGSEIVAPRTPPRNAP